MYVFADLPLPAASPLHSLIKVKLGKTITTYLVGGNPRGIKSVFISNRICHCLAIPRAHLGDASQHEALQSPSLYLLLGDNHTAYIGETENVRERIKQHNHHKDFWNEVLVLVARDNSLSKADVQFLEYLSIQYIKEANLYNLHSNKHIPKAPSLPEHQRDTVLEYFEDVKMLYHLSRPSIV